MKKDIESKEDIQLLVDTFYETVKVDATIGYFFSDVTHVNWEKHLPIMYSFWENILFHTGTYAGNPMKTHMQLHEKSAMNTTHFERWLEIFNHTVNSLFEGGNAELIKQRALSIATTMQIKIVYKHPLV